MTLLLHAHAHGGFFEEVLLHALTDTLRILPFLLLTYVLMEFLEHHASDKMNAVIEKCGPFAPLVGGLLGMIPQCGFSSAAAGLYAGRTITLGTLVAVFLSTSDEMLPILIAGNARPGEIVTLVLSKAVIGIAVGFLVGGILRLRKKKSVPDIHAHCEAEGCHCERGIFLSALYHTLTVAAFILFATAAIDALIYFIGEENIRTHVLNVPVLTPFLCALLGLIPSCAVSVVMTELYLEGMLSAGALLAGLLPGAGAGVLVLLRTNKNMKENLSILGLLVAVGFIFGLMFDLFGLSRLLA